MPASPALPVLLLAVCAFLSVYDSYLAVKIFFKHCNWSLSALFPLLFSQTRNSGSFSANLGTIFITSCPCCFNGVCITDLIISPAFLVFNFFTCSTSSYFHLSAVNKALLFGFLYFLQALRLFLCQMQHSLQSAPWFAFSSQSSSRQREVTILEFENKRLFPFCPAFFVQI